MSEWPWRRKEAGEELEAALLDAGDLSDEQRQQAEAGAREVAEAFLAAWAEGAWEDAVGAVQETWRATYAEKTQQDELEPLERRLMDERGGVRPGATWRELTGGTVAGLLEVMLGRERPVVWEVTEATARGIACVDVVADVVVRDRLGGRERRRMQMRVVRETAPYEPAGPEGEWGVNPTSVARARG